MRFLIPDRFSVLRVLGEDSNSRTFVATDHVLGRSDILVKILRKRSFNSYEIEQFCWFAGVRHKNLSVVFDTGVTLKGDFYYVREYLPTSELFSSDTLSTVKALVSAVDFLRSHCRVHGGIKPSNIFLNGASLKLTDASFARESEKSEEDIRFSAPELLKNESRTLESDLYSLGAVLYRLVTRRNLFEDINLANLKTKHIWASPLPIGNLGGIPRTISDAIFELLSKDPQSRVRAFDKLKDRLAPEPVAADRAPFIGRDSLLTETLAKVRETRNKGPYVLLVEGPPGIGKSRFIEELRTRSSLAGLLFVKSSCDMHCAELDAVRQLLAGLHADLDDSSRSKASAHNFGGIVLESSFSSDKAKRNSLIEQLITDLRAACGYFGQQSPVVLAIEDIDKADSATVQLLQRIATRGTGTRVVFILTQRSGQAGLKLRTSLSDYLPADCHMIRLSPLSEQDSRTLLGILERRVERHPQLLQISRGNPRFLEYYAGPSATSPKTRPLPELQWLVSQIPRQAKDLARAMSTFAAPTGLETVAQMSNVSGRDLQMQIQLLEDLGVTALKGNMLEIAYPALATLIYRTTSRANRVALAKRRSDIAAPTDADIQHVAYCLFEAGMFAEAATIYQQLAKAAYDQQNLRTAANWYERLQECAQRSNAAFEPHNALHLARCYQWTGKQLKARVLCKGLLSVEAVRKDPELLSEVYSRLGGIYDTISGEERVRLARLAVECLPPLSPKTSLRYLSLVSRLLETGDISGAGQALEMARRFVMTDRDRALVEGVRGSYFINIGDFRNAIDSFSKTDEQYVLRPPLLNNLALSYENLGDLRSALQFQSETCKLATSSGLRHVQILSLSNLGSIKTKLGDTREAENLFASALASADEWRKTDETFDMTRLLTVYCDTALHSVYIGKYRRAAECLNRIEPAAGSVFELDRVYYRIAQCLIYSAMGAEKRVQSLLALLHNSETFRQPFFQVEHALIGADIRSASNEEKLNRLQSALMTSRELGTLHQQCRVLNQLAIISLSNGQPKNAEEYATSAWELARQHGYKPLATNAQLLIGTACGDPTNKARNLMDAHQNASEMGLLEIVAESACHLGVHYLELQNLITAREYLSRSVSTIEALAEEIPLRLQPRYLAKPWRQLARGSLQRCNAAMQERGIYLNVMAEAVPGDDRYFKATYRLALAAAAVKSTDALLSLIEETLRTSSARGATITLKEPKQTFVRGIRIKVSAEITQRIVDVSKMAKNRLYFGCPDMARPKETVAWIPLRSETREGGIYVVCRQNEAPLTEKEMELLAIIGTIANGALRELETNHDGEFENAQLAELHGMIGTSKAIRDVYAQIQIAARNTATVLIEGESGTGKELVAKAIHAAGPRAKEPFIAVDCGAIPEALIEAELFGAKKGSYTGAVVDRPGLFEAANRGTIFLDEISNTTPALQAKLLRVIQEREIRRIGETKDRRIDVRLIVASNANLDTLVSEGRFRKDLLYRLKVLYVKTPPLRSRRDDIPMLAHAFLQKLNAANKLKKYFSPGVLNHLSTQTFPGNVRELQNAIERAFFSAKGGAITDVPLESQLQSPSDGDEVMSWFKELSEGRKDFWSAIHNRYKRRDISRDKIRALLDLGLRSTRGSYKNLASTFHLKERDYRRFMDFLRRNECLLDFRPYRKDTDDAQ